MLKRLDEVVLDIDNLRAAIAVCPVIGHTPEQAAIATILLSQCDQIKKLVALVAVGPHLTDADLDDDSKCILWRSEAPFDPLRAII